MTGSANQSPDGGAAGAASGKGAWADLRVRVLSGIVVAALGVGLLSSHGLLLVFGISLLVGLMAWELAQMTGEKPHSGNHALLTGSVAGASMLISLLLPGAWSALLVLVPILFGLPRTARAFRPHFALFILIFFGAGYGLYLVRENYGLMTTFWIAGTVVISDIAGYFVGRWLGGPKFWPAISPKKTWSGTVAGWIGAFLFALVLILAMNSSDWSLLIAGPVVALAGQFGDIAESWLKRRVGVKDSSDLIPGHGGVMDRFDALSGAFLVALPMYLLGL